jgi:hypothetical protein
MPTGLQGVTAAPQPAPEEGKSLEFLQARSREIRQELGGLAFENIEEGLGSVGFESANHHDPDHSEWVQVDWGVPASIDEFVFCRVELAEFVVNHSELATGIGEGWIGLESSCVKFESGVEVAVLRGIRALIGEAKSLCELIRRGRGILDVREAIRNRDLQIAWQKRELANDFPAKVPMRGQILIGEESEVGELDDESVHRDGSLFVCRCAGRDFRRARRSRFVKIFSTRFSLRRGR